MSGKSVSLRNDGAVAVVTVDRPEALNALSTETLDELDGAFRQACAEEGTRAIVLTGAGEKAFVAGADIREMSALDAPGAHRYARRGQAVLARIERSGKPVVAAVNGFALGGGCELALACHIRVASEKARFGQPEVKLGVMTGFGGSQRLTRIVGRGRALEILLTGELLDAAQAHRLGLVNRVVPHERVMGESLNIARTLASRAPIALRYTLQAVLDGEGAAPDEACALEAGLFGLCFGTDDQSEGMRAFLEKREARFEGR